MIQARAASRKVAIITASSLCLMTIEFQRAVLTRRVIYDRYQIASGNLGRADRLFVRILFGKQPEEARPGAPAGGATHGIVLARKDRYLVELFALIYGYEQHSLTLSREARDFASRGVQLLSRARDLRGSLEHRRKDQPQAKRPQNYSHRCFTHALVASIRFD
jgi:hypothetical protein